MIMIRLHLHNKHHNDNDRIELIYDLLCCMNNKDV